MCRDLCLSQCVWPHWPFVSVYLVMPLRLGHSGKYVWFSCQVLIHLILNVSVVSISWCPLMPLPPKMLIVNYLTNIHVSVCTNTYKPVHPFQLPGSLKLTFQERTGSGGTGTPTSDHWFISRDGQKYVLCIYKDNCLSHYFLTIFNLNIFHVPF